MDSILCFSDVVELIKMEDAVAFSGLFFFDEIRCHGDIIPNLESCI
jgi:hypothetical protein